MQLVGLKVTHKRFGDGVITAAREGYFTVEFAFKTAEFVYPDIIACGILQVERTEIYDAAVADMQKKAAERELSESARIKKIEQELEAKRQKEEEKKRKRVERRNVAFKCTYCDGGKSDGQVGFSGPCSECNMKNNVLVNKRVWCSTGSKCSAYLQGNATYDEVVEAYKKQILCYESTMLERWVAGAGYVQSGKRKGTPMHLEQVQVSSLAVLTTRLPGDEESKRQIFALFLVDEACEGDNREEGWVTTNSQWKIKLTPDEAKQILFWNYYFCENAPEVIRFGSGLHRYISDMQAAQILRDVAAVKTGEEKAFAEQFLAEFCKRVRLEQADIEEKSGALVKNKE